MLEIFLEGVILGLIIAITLGPAFFAIVQTAIHRGFYPAMFIALGISLSDISLIALSYLGASIIFENPANKIYIGLAGGIILIIFGLVTFKRKTEIPQDNGNNYNSQSEKKPRVTTYILKGYFLNILNPFLLIFWLSAMSWVSARAEEGHLLNYVITFFGGTLITVFATDLLKSFIGNKLTKYLHHSKINWINKIVGLLLIAFGIILEVRVLWQIL